MNCCEHCAELQRRVAALEEMVFRTHRSRNAILKLLAEWPGPFTVQQIESALKEREPEISAGLKPYAIASTIARLEKSGTVSRITNGTGCVASIFQVIGQIPKAGGRPGRQFNRKADYESGFRNIVRTALADLPPVFTLDDLRKWVTANLPDVQIPYGSWSSTLYKLQQHGELDVVKMSHRLRGKVYARGSRRVAPSGDEVKALEQSWQNFRAGIIVPQEEQYLPPLQREKLENP